MRLIARIIMLPVCVFYDRDELEGNGCCSLLCSCGEGWIWGDVCGGWGDGVCYCGRHVESV